MRRWRPVLALVALTLATPSLALDPSLSLSQLKHTIWSSENGAPMLITDIVQTPDGYLWLATGDGLFRFDGITFEHIRLFRSVPSATSRPMSLATGPSGMLWIGFSHGGGVGEYRDGVFHDLRMPNSGQQITSVKRDTDGAIWAIKGGFKDNGLVRYAKGQWQTFGVKDGLPDEEITSLQPALDRTLWVATLHRVAFLRPGDHRFQLLPDKFSTPSLALSPGGRLWVSDKKETRPITEHNQNGDRVLRFPAVANVRSPRILFDRDGSIWGATHSVGLFRIKYPAAHEGQDIESYRVAQGLTSDEAQSIFEDREGNIWLGEVDSLERFRQPAVIFEESIPIDQAIPTLATGDGVGNIFVLQNKKILLIVPRGMPRAIADQSGEYTAFCGGGDRDLAIVTSAGLKRFVGGKPVATREPAVRDWSSYGCVYDAAGRIWIGLRRGGVLVFDGLHWRTIKVPVRDDRVFPDIVKSADGTSVYVIRDSEAIWQFSEKATHQIALNTLSIGSIDRMFASGNSLFVSGNRGIARFSGEKISVLPKSKYPSLTSLFGFVQTPEGMTWGLSFKGISASSSDAVNHAFAGGNVFLPYRRFERKDGFNSTIQRPYVSGPQLLRGGDGRIWALSGTGIFSIDPPRIPRNSVTPDAIIKSVTTPNAVYEGGHDISLPPGSSKLVIDYTALSLQMPEYIRFRYRLIGQDDGWVDAGTSRQATYTNLQPGKFRFEILAANTDGVWSTKPGAIGIVIAPTFFQTNWFKALCILAICGLLWLMYRLRLQVVSARLRERLGVRLAERERIARELHDTLLQGVQGLMLRLQSVAEDIRAGLPVEQSLDKALDRADEVFQEGRRRVQNLRASNDSGDLRVIFANIAGRQMFSSETEIRIIVDGMPRALKAYPLEEISKIAEEALFNIWRHAHARNVEILISFGSSKFEANFRDDGIGITPEIVAMGRPGHFGLSGMRERARKVGGKLSVKNATGGGTEVAIAVRARRIYSRTGQRFPWSLFSNRKEGQARE